ncbi:MAG: FAD-binding oxidoreductase [Deltaproteobacteria bacterium]|nr:FAD-binding oxidoreductase [Deltaproteobacteria bacterium]
MLSQESIENFKNNLRGQLIQPSDPEFEEARKVYNGMIDKKPLMIARCLDVADVMSAINFGRENKLLTAIRGGGHNGPGLGTCDDGLVIDLSLMKGLRVNPKTKTVSVEPGCTQGDMDHACHAFGLAVPAGIVSTTGVAGLTLGGGHGYLSRQHGLTIDNLLEVDMVLADGSFVTANENQNEDLFWAVRGGGGNFGVVTNFVFQAHPVKMIYGGLVFWDINHGKQVMQWYRDFQKKAPVELCTFLGLKRVPATAPFPEEIWGEKICALISCYNGPQEAGEKAMKPIFDELPQPIFQHVGEMPFTMIQSLFDPLLPKGLQWYWKGDFIKELSDEAIDIHLKYAEKSPTPMSLVHLYPIDGAVHHVAPQDTAWSCRDATWSMVIAGIDPDPSNADALKKWGREYWQAIHPHGWGAAYVNFMMEEGEDRIKASYGINHQRLASIKKKYDPNNFFRVNQNIKPE